LIIPLKKLVAFDKNKYVFSRATMVAIDKLGNIQGYPEEEEEEWKIVPHILKMMLDDDIKYNLEDDE
jgi:hypothetical protein